jgi:hypothetical protein
MTRDELARRFQQYNEDKNGLPLYGKNSRDGHLQQIVAKQRYLRKLLQEADARGCSPYAWDAWIYATRPPPKLS